jgi:putative ribosome biogenesis GTPase RsgA
MQSSCCLIGHSGIGKGKLVHRLWAFVNGFDW